MKKTSNLQISKLLNTIGRFLIHHPFSELTCVLWRVMWGGVKNLRPKVKGHLQHGVSECNDSHWRLSGARKHGQMVGKWWHFCSIYQMMNYSQLVTLDTAKRRFNRSTFSCTVNTVPKISILYNDIYKLVVSDFSTNSFVILLRATPSNLKIIHDGHSWRPELGL